MYTRNDTRFNMTATLGQVKHRYSLEVDDDFVALCSLSLLLTKVALV